MGYPLGMLVHYIALLVHGGITFTQLPGWHRPHLLRRGTRVCLALSGVLWTRGYISMKNKITLNRASPFTLLHSFPHISALFLHLLTVYLQVTLTYFPALRCQIQS